MREGEGGLDRLYILGGGGIGWMVCKKAAYGGDWGVRNGSKRALLLGYAYGGVLWGLGVTGGDTDGKDLKELSEDDDELAIGAIEQQMSCLRKNIAYILEP